MYTVISFNFSGKRVLITGGTSGIGRSIGEAFAAAGAQVWAAGLPGPEPLPARLQPLALDVTDAAAVTAAVSALGELDVLVNAAGVIRRDAEFEPEVFSQVLDINLTGTMRACVAARPLLAKRGGAIVNIASMLSYFGGARVPAYSASKGGVAVDEVLGAGVGGGWDSGERGGAGLDCDAANGVTAAGCGEIRPVAVADGAGTMGSA